MCKHFFTYLILETELQAVENRNLREKWYRWYRNKKSFLCGKIETNVIFKPKIHIISIKYTYNWKRSNYAFLTENCKNLHCIKYFFSSHISSSEHTPVPKQEYFLYRVGCLHRGENDSPEAQLHLKIKAKSHYFLLFNMWRY